MSIATDLRDLIAELEYALELVEDGNHEEAADQLESQSIPQAWVEELRGDDANG